MKVVVTFAHLASPEVPMITDWECLFRLNTQQLISASNSAERPWHFPEPLI